MPMPPKTMFEKIWDSHVVHEESGQPSVIYVDLHLIHEVTTPQAFEGLRMAGRKVRRPDLTVATVDHNTPTWDLGLTRDGRNFQEAAGRSGGQCQGHGDRILRPLQPKPGHCPRHRARLGLYATGHDGGLRRQSHLDSRRVGVLCAGYRHFRSGTCFGHPDPEAIQTQDDGSARQRAVTDGRGSQGRDPGHHRSDWHQRRDRPRYRVHRRSDPRALQWTGG